ncbi:MAG: hypothetical protein HYW57_10080 [Ignavibacteriales bacterium]|nr:hypothetical protein [Ignavibacteriales bacterium]
MRITFLLVFALPVLGACKLPPEPTLDNPYDLGGDYFVFPPKDVRIYSQYYSVVTITWSQGSSKSSSGFIVERSVNEQPFERVDSLDIQSVFFVDNTVKTQYSYRYRVRSIFGNGSVGTPSEVLGIVYRIRGTTSYPVLTGLSGNITALGFNWTSELISAADDNGVVRTWSIYIGTVTGGTSLSVGAPITSLRYAPNNDTFVMGVQDSSLRFSSGQRIATPSVPTQLDWGFGGMIACGFQDGKIRIYDSNTKQLTRTIDAHAGAVSSLRFSPDGLSFASSASDGLLKLWNAASFTLMQSAPSAPTSTLAFTADSRQVAVVDTAAGSATWYDVEDLTPTKTLSTGIEALRWLGIGSDNFTTVAVGENPSWKVWEHLGDREFLLPSATLPALTLAAISPSSRFVLLGGANGYVQPWLFDNGWKAVN